LFVSGSIYVSWCCIHGRNATSWTWAAWYGTSLTHELSNAAAEKN